MRGFHDEMGGPDSVASPSEWGPLSFGDEGMTAAGLPASPGRDHPTRAEMISEVRAAYEREMFAPIDLPPEVRRRVLFERGMRFLREQPSEDTLRHNFLLRRHLTDPGYGASRELSWREKAANGLGVPYVGRALTVGVTRACRAYDASLKPSPSG